MISDDQQLFSLCEAGGGSVPAEEEQRSSEPSMTLTRTNQDCGICLMRQENANISVKYTLKTNKEGTIQI